MKKTAIIKVNINCQICKTDVLKAVTKLEGVDEVSVDGEKGTVKVVGEVDPVAVVKQLRKAGKTADIVRFGVGPPPKPPSNRPPLPPCCDRCQLVAVGYVTEDSRLCTIL